MIDIEKLDKEATKIIRSFTREKLLEWVEMDKKRMAKADAEWAKMTKEERLSQIFASNCGMALDIALSNGSLNGAPKKRATKPKTSTTAQKNAPAKSRTTQPRSSDGKFASVKKTTRKATAFA